jgi:hypothetical protein
MNVTTKQKVPFVSLFLAGLLWPALQLLGGCAGQVMPSGGPPDTIPPSIVRSYPDSDAVRVVPDRIELEFGEYVDRRSVEDAVFISPYVGQLEFDWSSTEVTVRFPEHLRKNTTYVITVGTDVADVRAGNKMAHAYSLAFSTGDSIDHGVISGRVFDDHPDGIMIFAYNLREMGADTLNPSHTRSQYIMQTGKDGSFRLKNIAFGPYRVIAVRDEYRNLVYDREIDQYGVAPQDVLVSDGHPEVRDLWFRMAKEDTTRPFLTSITAVDRRHLLVRFSEAVDTLAFPHAVFTLHDTTRNRPVDIAAIYQNMGNQALAGVETRDPLDSTSSYRLTVRGIIDRAGNVLDSNNASSTFAGTPVPDTARPYPTVRGIADSARGVDLRPAFEMDFGRPLDLGGILHGVALMDSNAHAVVVSVRPRSSAEVLVAPETPLKSFAWYTLRVTLDSLRDSRGQRYRDSTYRLRFQTLDARALGTVEGSITGASGAYAVILSAVTTDVNPQRIVTRRLDHAGKFQIDQLPELRYNLQAFEDVDGDGKFRAGLPYPFTPSARFAVGADTIKVRARWSVEGVQVKFPQDEGSAR